MAMPAISSVIAGNRRLAALREVYKDAAKPPKVLCICGRWTRKPPMHWPWRKTLSAKPMHPLDEAEAFAKLGRRRPSASNPSPPNLELASRMYASA